MGYLPAKTEKIVRSWFLKDKIPSGSFLFTSFFLSPKLLRFRINQGPVLATARDSSSADIFRPITVSSSEVLRVRRGFLHPSSFEAKTSPFLYNLIDTHRQPKTKTFFLDNMHNTWLWRSGAECQLQAKAL